MSDLKLTFHLFAIKDRQGVVEYDVVNSENDSLQLVINTGRSLELFAGRAKYLMKWASDRGLEYCHSEITLPFEFDWS